MKIALLTISSSSSMLVTHIGVLQLRRTISKNLAGKNLKTIKNFVIITKYNLAGL